MIPFPLFGQHFNESFCTEKNLMNKLAVFHARELQRPSSVETGWREDLQLHGKVEKREAGTTTNIFQKYRLDSQKHECRSIKFSLDVKTSWGVSQVITIFISEKYKFTSKFTFIIERRSRRFESIFNTAHHPWNPPAFELDNRSKPDLGRVYSKKWSLCALNKASSE